MRGVALMEGARSGRSGAPAAVADQSPTGGKFQRAGAGVGGYSGPLAFWWPDSPNTNKQKILKGARPPCTEGPVARKYESLHKQRG